MTPDAGRRPIHESLTTWEEAEKKQQAVLVDTLGDYHLVYPSVTQYSPETALEMKQLAIEHLVSKIKRELLEWSAKTDLETTQSLISRMPSLEPFARSGKLGNLRKEWQALQEYRTQSLARLQQNRQTVFNEFKNLLPAGDLRFEEDGTAILTCHLNSSEDRSQIRKDIADINAYKLGVDKKYSNFTKDLDRMEWIIEGETSSQSFGLGMYEDKLKAIENLFGENTQTFSTLSKFMNQASLSLTEVPFALKLPQDRQVVLNPEYGSKERVIAHLRVKEDVVRFSLKAYLKISSVTCDTGATNQRFWKVNDGSRWSGNTGVSNYGKLSQVVVDFDKARAEKGDLEISESGQIMVATILRLRPSVPSHRIAAP